jgi:hypothetical protein
MKEDSVVVSSMWRCEIILICSCHRSSTKSVVFEDKTTRKKEKKCVFRSFVDLTGDWQWNWRAYVASCREDLLYWSSGYSEPKTLKQRSRERFLKSLKDEHSNTLGLRIWIHWWVSKRFTVRGLLQNNQSKQCFFFAVKRLGTLPFCRRWHKMINVILRLVSDIIWNSFDSA